MESGRKLNACGRYEVAVSAGLDFPFSIFHFSFVITGQRLLPGAGLPVFKWQMKNVKWKMENLDLSFSQSSPAQLPSKEPAFAGFFRLPLQVRPTIMARLRFSGVWCVQQRLFQVIVSLIDIEAHLILTKRPEEKLYCLVINFVEASPRRAS